MFAEPGRCRDRFDYLGSSRPRELGLVGLTIGATCAPLIGVQREARRERLGTSAECPIA